MQLFGEVITSQWLGLKYADFIITSRYPKNEKTPIIRQGLRSFKEEWLMLFWISSNMDLSNWEIIILKMIKIINHSDDPDQQNHCHDHPQHHTSIHHLSQRGGKEHCLNSSWWHQIFVKMFVSPISNIGVFWIYITLSITPFQSSKH